MNLTHEYQGDQYGRNETVQHLEASKVFLWILGSQFLYQFINICFIYSILLSQIKPMSSRAMEIASSNQQNKLLFIALVNHLPDTLSESNSYPMPFCVSTQRNCVVVLNESA